jgi:hydroxyacylglutathione hydrolase
MNIKQYYLGCLSHASYMITDPKSKTAVIVDPQRDVDEYVKDAKEAGVQISDVVLTHFHADFVAGHLELQEKTGARINLGAKAQPEYQFTARHEGESITFGDTRLEFLETPGHTPEGMSVLAYDLQQPNGPIAVLTGDTLFVGDVGRPDLAAAAGHSPQELAGQLYDSLHQKLLNLPDATTVYPAHGPGSLCGSAGLQGKVSTIGKERRENPMLQYHDKQQFVSAITSHLPNQPAYFAHDAELNKSERPTLEEMLAVQNQPINLSQALEQIEQGAQILDVRSPNEFAAGHLKGSVNIALEGRYAEWAGSLLDLKHPVVVVAAPGREQEALIRLNRVGFENIAGHLEGGVAAIADRPDLQAIQPRVTAEQLSARLNQPNPPKVIDVRTPGEFSKGHLPGATNIPLNQLLQRKSEIPEQGEVVIQCQSGYRSSIAASLIARPDLLELQGGYQAWTAAGLPVET